MKTILDLHNIYYSYHTSHGETRALSNLSFSLAPGEFAAVVGPSGCGKSTIFRLTNQLLPRRSGEILVDGKSIDGRRGYCGYMPQRDLLFPWRTVNENLRLPMEIRGGISRAEMDKRAAETLEHVGLAGWGDKRPEELSGGMRQRCVLAVALALDPLVLFADEPTTALDVTIQAQILELMNDLRHKLGMSIIMITHDLGVVAQMCEKIAVMYAGHIVEYGTTDEIFYNPQHEYTKGLINSIPKLNAEEKERLVPIEGQPVDLLNPPAGCPFAPRCKSCMKVCLNKMPPRTELSDTHYTYCWLRQKEEFEKGAKPDERESR